MRRLAILAALAGSVLAGPAGAYQYGLQFTPNYGARGLVVAGYTFSGNTVVGNCSYYTVTGGGSGRGGGYHSHTTYYNQTCGWDLFGNLLSMTPGAPTAPAPLSTSDGRTIYARNAAGDVTGVDAAGGNSGFVNTQSAQYAITTPSGGYVFLQNQKPVAVRLTLRSQGDFPLVVSKIDPAAQLAKLSVSGTTCQKAPVKPGATCVIVLKYDPTNLPPGDDPYTAYDHLTVGIVSNSGQAPDFSESIEVAVAPGG
jgi:hypothetical protein